MQNNNEEQFFWRGQSKAQKSPDLCFGSLKTGSKAQKSPNPCFGSLKTGSKA
jgi:hypothetical protein